MSKFWRITQVVDDGDFIWMTMLNAPSELLEPNTQHLRTFYPVKPDDRRPRSEIVKSALDWLNNRAAQAVANRTFDDSKSAT